jgi:phage tail P2-like protein
VSPDGEFVCIDDSQKVLARFASFINHPGDLHQAMIKNTPAFYFESPSKDRDPTIAFYRPFADALQDIFDEQDLLKGVNFVDKIPVEYIPYLAYILGLDMPYFPSTTDEIRRALLRNGRKLQQLKGSRRAIRELFEIFGFTIDISNLWYSKDGKRFIAPNEPLPDDIADQEITTEEVCHAEPLLNAFSDPGFGQIEIPLLFRPLGNMTVDAWLVEDGSPEDIALSRAVDKTAADVEVFTTDNCALTIDGFQSLTTLQSSIPNNALGHSTILIDQDLDGIDEVQTGTGQPLNAEGVTYSKDRNSLTIVFDRYLAFDRGQKLYIFATYERQKIILPDDLADLRSNRFDINILLFKDGEQPTSDIFEFLLEFLFKFKAFHSLLRKIIFSVDCDAIYNVTDFCAGGTQAQHPLTTAGQLQTPPPTIPDDIGSDGDIECSDDGIRAGSSDKDIALRSHILSLLEEEHETWKSLDGTHDIPNALLPILQSASRIQLRPGDSGSCEFTQFGQDRVLATDSVDYDHNDDLRQKLCDIEGNAADYCYKGRVGQEIDTDRTLILEEILRCKPCTLSGGVGNYYMTPLVPDNEFSGGDPGTSAADLTRVENLYRSRHDSNYVRVMAFDNPQIHYSDRAFLDDINDKINNRFFATRKPSLEVQKDNMLMPGHRFLSMGNLKDDFVHPDYYFRPWDYIFGISCPEDLEDGAIVPDLDAHFEQNTAGDDVLVINQVQLVYYGNNLPADIPQMNNHALSALIPNDITHSIWSSAHPGLSFIRSDQEGTEREYTIDQAEDGLRYTVEALGVQKDIICFSDTLGPIFESANRDCECIEDDVVLVGQSLEDVVSEITGTGTGTEVGSTRGADFIDGYPSEYGIYEADISEFDFPRESIEGYGISIYGVNVYGGRGGEESLGAAIALGLPINPRGVLELQFKVGSAAKVVPADVEYRFYEPHRLDCACEHFECPVDETGVTDATGTGTGTDITVTGATSKIPLEVERCHLDLYQLNDGSYDWNCDRVILQPTMILNEKYGAISCLADGSIPNMMSFDDEKIVFSSILTAFDDAFPQEGSYQFIDDYGIIHIGVFETTDDKLDITTQLRDPRVWGEPPTGEVRNFRTFRDGIITTKRQIIQVADFGYVIIAEGAEQVVQRFQTTFGCGDEQFEDPFAFHLCANIVDDVNIVVTRVTAGTGVGTGGVVFELGFGVGDYGLGGFGE